MDQEQKNNFQEENLQGGLRGTPNPIYKKVLLDQRILAGLFLRLVTFVIDLVPVGSLTAVLTPLFTGQAISKNLVSILIYLAYFVLTTDLTKGQTLGKMIPGLKVVRADDKELNWADVFFREACCQSILKMALPLYLLAGATDKKQHLGDLIYDTMVIRAAYEQELFYEQAYQIPSYQESYFI